MKGPRPAWRIFAKPSVYATLCLFGLVLALVKDGPTDLLAIVCVGACLFPIVTIFFKR